jgi:hypothetical protein
MTTSGSGPKNYTTSVAAMQTASECLALLVKHDARQVSIDLDGGEPTGLSFIMKTAWGPRQFALPVNVAGTRKKLAQECSRPSSPVQPRHTTPEHARRVAWRVMKDWLDAQLAITAAGLAELTEIMLPWMRVDSGHTIWQAYQEHELKSLESSS